MIKLPNSQTTLDGLRGTLVNLILAFYFDFLYRELSQYEVYRDVKLPIYWIAFIALLLIAEPFAYRYIIGLEYTRYTERLQLPWASLGKSLYMWLMALFSLIFRCMFKILIVTRPLLQYLLKPLESTLGHYPGLLKAPTWIVGAAVVAAEGYILLVLIEPKRYKYLFVSELLSRWVTSTLMCVWLVFTVVLLKDLAPNPLTSHHGISAASFWFPFLLVFNLFFIPIRFVEFYTDWIDCQTSSQKGLYILSMAFVLYRVFAY